jgi:hypothetical protein
MRNRHSRGVKSLQSNAPHTKFLTRHLYPSPDPALTYPRNLACSSDGHYRANGFTAARSADKNYYALEHDIVHWKCTDAVDGLVLHNPV